MYFIHISIDVAYNIGNAFYRKGRKILIDLNGKYLKVKICGYKQVKAYKDDILSSMLTKDVNFSIIKKEKNSSLCDYVHSLQICLLILVISALFPTGDKMCQHDVSDHRP